MKIRNGFVSNSSSSSFLVAFPRNPKSATDIKEMVFGDREFLNSPYASDKHPANTISKYIWDDVEKQIPNNKKYIARKLGSLLGNKYEDYYIPEPGKKYWECEFDEDRYAHDNAEALSKFMEKNKGAFFYCFEYSDNEGNVRSDMEHGDLFRDLPHIISSNH